MSSYLDDDLKVFDLPTRRVVCRAWWSDLEQEYIARATTAITRDDEACAHGHANIKEQAIRNSLVGLMMEVRRRSNELADISAEIDAQVNYVSVFVGKPREVES